MVWVQLYSIGVPVNLNHQDTIRAAMRAIIDQNAYDMDYMKPTPLYGNGAYDFGLDTDENYELEDVMAQQEHEYRQALLANFNRVYRADWEFLHYHLAGSAGNPIVL